MKKQTTYAVALGLGLLLLLIAAIVTRPPIPEPSPTAPGDSTFSPLENPLLKHMQEEEGIDFGSTPDHGVAILVEDDMVRVVFSESVLEKLGPGAAVRLNLIDGERTLKAAQFERFLNDLHDIVVEAEGLEHHDH